MSRGGPPHAQQTHMKGVPEEAGGEIKQQQQKCFIQNDNSTLQMMNVGKGFNLHCVTCMHQKDTLESKPRVPGC